MHSRTELQKHYAIWHATATLINKAFKTETMTLLKIRIIDFVKFAFRFTLRCELLCNTSEDI